jgi:hypothetical protein
MPESPSRTVRLATSLSTCIPPPPFLSTLQLMPSDLQPRRRRVRSDIDARPQIFEAFYSKKVTEMVKLWVWGTPVASLTPRDGFTLFGLTLP